MKKFFKDMLSNGTAVSSKRVLGLIGYVSAIVFIALWARDLIDLLLVTSASLVGLETVTSIFAPKQKS